MNTLYTEAKKLGIPIDHHESDLYLQVNDDSNRLVAKYDKYKLAKQFRSRTDNKMWWDIPFKFDPFWEKKSR